MGRLLPLLASYSAYVVLLVALVIYPIFQYPSESLFLLVNGVPLLAGLLIHVVAHTLTNGRERQMLEVYDILVIVPLVSALVYVAQVWGQPITDRIAFAEFYIFLNGRDAVFAGVIAIVFLGLAPSGVRFLYWLYAKSHKIDIFVAELIGREQRKDEPLVFSGNRILRLIVLTETLAVIFWVIVILLGLPTYVGLGIQGESFLLQAYAIMIAPIIVGCVLLLEARYQDEGSKASHFFFKLVFSSSLTLGIFLSLATRLELARFTLFPIGMTLVAALMIGILEKKATTLAAEWSNRRQNAVFGLALFLGAYGLLFLLLPVSLWESFLTFDSVLGTGIGMFLLSFFIYTRTIIGESRDATKFAIVSSVTTVIVLVVRFTNVPSAASTLAMSDLPSWTSGFLVLAAGALIFHRFPLASPIIIGAGLLFTDALWPAWFVVFPLMMISIAQRPLSRLTMFSRRESRDIVGSGSDSAEEFN